MIDRLKIISALLGALLFLQALLGVVLFVKVVGYTPDAIFAYYAKKSIHGLFEVVVPHSVFITIALAGVVHFLYFLESVSLGVKRFFTNTLFVLFVLDQGSVFLILQGFMSAAYAKLFAVTAFLTLFGAIVWVVSKEALGESKEAFGE